MYRQVTEGMWKGPEDLSSQSAKRAEDMGRASDLDMLSSPPFSLNDLGGSASLANWMPMSGSDPDALGPEQDSQPATTYRSRALDELPSRRAADKSVSAEVRLVMIMTYLFNAFIQTDPQGGWEPATFLSAVKCSTSMMNYTLYLCILILCLCVRVCM